MFESVQLKINAKIKDIAAQSESFFVLTEDGNLFTWGWNEHGNLGVGDTRSRGVDEICEVPFNHPINQIWCGGAILFAQY